MNLFNDRALAPVPTALNTGSLVLFNSLPKKAITFHISNILKLGRTQPPNFSTVLRWLKSFARLALATLALLVGILSPLHAGPTLSSPPPEVTVQPPDAPKPLVVQVYLIATRAHGPPSGAYFLIVARGHIPSAGVGWHAYCGGDPVNYADPSGLDRIAVSGGKMRWLFTGSASVWTLGTTPFYASMGYVEFGKRTSMTEFGGGMGAISDDFGGGNVSMQILESAANYRSQIVSDEELAGMSEEERTAMVKMLVIMAANGQFSSDSQVKDFFGGVGQKAVGMGKSVLSLAEWLNHYGSPGLALSGQPVNHSLSNAINPDATVTYWLGDNLNLRSGAAQIGGGAAEFVDDLSNLSGIKGAAKIGWKLSTLAGKGLLHVAGRAGAGMKKLAMASMNANPAAASKVLEKLGEVESSVSGRAIHQVGEPRLPKHHTDPKVYGGDPNQPLVAMSEWAHQDLHRDMQVYARMWDESHGTQLVIGPGHGALEIQRLHGRSEMGEFLRDFYKRMGSMYPEAAAQFNSLHP